MAVPRSRTALARLALVVSALALGACGGRSGAISAVPPEEAAPRAAATGGAGDGPAAPRASDQAGGVRLARVAGGLGDALYVTAAPGERNRLYVVRQSGRILVLDRGRPRARPFIDLSRLTAAGGERGLLGLAFHPGYARNGRFFVNYTDRSGDTNVVEYRRAAPGRADARSARRLLLIRQPYANHNGGHLAFGPGGLLHIATGDGGGGGDPEDNAQDPGSLLGKLLRIDVDRRAGGRPYGIPAGNPFARGGGAPEVFAYGLRNPWRFSFDRRRGDLWIGDVGQNAIEEISFRPAGRAAGTNFGWNAFEGREPYAGGGPVRGRRPVAPVAQYTHAQGCSVTGGYVYRGARVPALRGRYVAADFCSGRVWTMRAGPRPAGFREITGRLGVRLGSVTSFGEGGDGELYVLAAGVLHRFAAA